MSAIIESLPTKGLLIAEQELDCAITMVDDCNDWAVLLAKGKSMKQSLNGDQAAVGDAASDCRCRFIDSRAAHKEVAA